MVFRGAAAVLAPTRTPTTVLVAFAITYLMRSAAASVSRITCGLGLAIPNPFSGFKARAESTLKIATDARL